MHQLELEAIVPSMENRRTKKNKRFMKKRAASDVDPSTPNDLADPDHGEIMNGVLVEDNVNEPTMGEKLSRLNLQDSEKSKNNSKLESSQHKKPPSADSVNILLKQALHADDQSLLLDCLYTQDEKIIAKSISLLNPADVLKLLHSLVTIIHSRGAVLACILPWLRSLLLQHATGIMTHESCLLALNSLYQLVESRVSTFQEALQLSSYLGLCYAGVADDEERERIAPIIYEDSDESDEHESDGEGMETDQDRREEEVSDDGFCDFEGSDEMSC